MADPTPSACSAAGLSRPPSSRFRNRLVRVSSTNLHMPVGGGVRKIADSRSRLRYRRRVGSTLPSLDAGARQRLTARFGDEVAPWLDELPGVLRALAQRWHFDPGPPVPRGSMSVVVRCRLDDGRGAVLKASPDH